LRGSESDNLVPYLFGISAVPKIQPTSSQVKPNSVTPSMILIVFFKMPPQGVLPGFRFHEGDLSSLSPFLLGEGTERCFFPAEVWLEGFKAEAAGGKGLGALRSDSVLLLSFENILRQEALDSSFRADMNSAPVGEMPPIVIGSTFKLLVGDQKWALYKK
jgi:hypothetical protein